MRKNNLAPEVISLGDACEETLTTAKQDWLRLWRGTRSNEVMLTSKSGVHEINVLLDHAKNQMHVIATIRGKGGVPSLTQHAKYERTGYGVYQKVLSTI
jgi:hypothetical protein